jgi:TatD DNase family protein
VQTAATAHPLEAFDPEAEVETFSTIHSAGAALALSAVDTHCHLFLMDDDAAEVVAAANAAGVERMVCVGIDPPTSRRSLELAESYRGVFATAGVHPHTASDFDDRAGSVVEELLAHPLVVGVGETGLDYYRRLSPVEDQHRAFRTHIALSRESGKPLVVHVREAWDDAMAILDEERAERVVLHCFTGDEAIAREAGGRGYTVSFAGNVTYPNAERMRRAASALSDDRVVGETDSPFLPPQDIRGSANSPSNVLAVLQAVADVRGVTLDQMVESSTRAALSAFPLLR